MEARVGRPTGRASVYISGPFSLAAALLNLREPLFFPALAKSM
jgi:hypothetical protein